MTGAVELSRFKISQIQRAKPPTLHAPYCRRFAFSRSAALESHMVSGPLVRHTSVTGQALTGLRAKDLPSHISLPHSTTISAL